MKANLNKVILTGFGVVIVPSLIVYAWALSRRVPVTPAVLIDVLALALVVVVFAIGSAIAGAYRLRAFTLGWFAFGVVVFAGWTIGTVWIKWLRGHAPYPITDLISPMQPNYIGDAIPDALVLASMGAAVWALAFWNPENSSKAWISRLSAAEYGRGRRATVKFVVATVLFLALTALVSPAAVLVVRLGGVELE